MVPVVAGLALAYCVCTAPAPIEPYAVMSVRPGSYNESDYLGGGTPWCGLNRGMDFEPGYWHSSLHHADVSSRVWRSPRLEFFPWPSSSTGVASPLDMAQGDSVYALDVDGCACESPSDAQSQLSIGALTAPNIVAPNEAGEVPPQLTEMSGARAARELRRAWANVMGRGPSDETVLLLAAHWAHETSGGRFMYNYNFGGIKGRGSSGLSCLREAHEGWGWRTIAGIDRFRAYRSATEGAEDYVSLLVRRYPQAIEAARSGDVLQFVKALRRVGYFTGSESAYAQSLIELAERGHRAGYNALRIGAEASPQVTNTSNRIHLRWLR